MHSLKLTASLPLKIDGWNTNRFLLGWPIFRWELLVLGRVVEISMDNLRAGCFRHHPSKRWLGIGILLKHQQYLGFYHDPFFLLSFTVCPGRVKPKDPPPHPGGNIQLLKSPGIPGKKLKHKRNIKNPPQKTLQLEVFSFPSSFCIVFLFYEKVNFLRFGSFFPSVTTLTPKVATALPEPGFGCFYGSPKWV